VGGQAKDAEDDEVIFKGGVFVDLFDETADVDADEVDFFAEVERFELFEAGGFGGVVAAGVEAVLDGVGVTGGRAARALDGIRRHGTSR
jgi:hypothetical protein